MKASTPLGISGRIAAAFQSNALTPLLAVAAMLLGLFAVMVTPREEEPQINVTMANVIIPFPLHQFPTVSSAPGAARAAGNWGWITGRNWLLVARR